MIRWFRNWREKRRIKKMLRGKTPEYATRIIVNAAIQMAAEEYIEELLKKNREENQNR